MVLIGIGVSIVVDATSNSCKRDGEDGANVIWYWRKGYVSLLWLQLIYIWLLFEPFLWRNLVAMEIHDVLGEAKLVDTLTKFLLGTNIGCWNGHNLFFSSLDELNFLLQKEWDRGIGTSDIRFMRHDLQSSVLTLEVKWA